MTCTHCGVQNANEDARYCASCGVVTSAGAKLSPLVDTNAPSVAVTAQGSVQRAPQILPFHATDNGEIQIVADSNTAKVGKAVAMTLAAGPIGLLAGAATRDLRAQCMKCGKVFAKSTYSYRVEQKMERFIGTGEVVLRSYTPPPIPAYDPNEVSAAMQAASDARTRAAVKKKEDKRFGSIAWLCIIAFFFWCAFGVGLQQFRFRSADIAADIVILAIAAGSTWGAFAIVRHKEKPALSESEP